MGVVAVRKELIDEGMGWSKVMVLVLGVRVRAAL